LETSPQGPRLETQRASIVFADIVGYTALSERAGPELAYALVTGALRLLDGIARRHGGVVDRYLGDALMAAFGLAQPGEDGAAGAVSAALEMRRALARYQEETRSPVPLALQVGINTGALLAADVRGAVVREFAVMGDAVNVAARLKDRAPEGAIWIGDETARGLGPGFALRALPELAVKGKLAQVAAHEVLPEGAEALHRGPSPDALGIAALVGREAELERLRSAVAAFAAGGPGGVVLVEGPPGIGKSRLLAELASSPEARDLGPVQAWAPPARLLEALLSEAPAGRPRLVLLDDVGACEPAALERLRPALLRAAPERRLFVLASRDGGTGLDARLGLAPDAGPRLALGALAEPAAAALVDAVVAADTAPGTRTRILARGRGNPMALLSGALLAPALETEAAREGGVERHREAERRRTTVLFADITGFTAMSERLDPREAHGIVSGCLALLDEVARKHGGTVDKYLGDCVMALYGAPVAIEDAPRAAVNAAIEMCRRVQDYNRERGIDPPIDVHVGVETGLAIAGDVSGPVLREYALMGDSVNAASRLKDLAPRGRVYVGAEAQRATRRHFEYRPLPPVSRGEGRAPLVFHELLSRREQLHRARIGSGSTLFLDYVGREQELSALRARLAEVSAGRGSIASVVAEPGLGKSRLFSELAEAPEAGGIRWLEARSLAMGSRLGFHPFVDLLRAWSGVEEAEGEAAAVALLERRLADLLGDESGEHLPLLASLLGLPLEGEAARRVAGMAGETRDRLTARSVRETLRAAAGRNPLVLLFEDLHWADASSVELLESLLRLADQVPICFLLAARPRFPDTSGRVLRAARALAGERLLEIELAPLTRSDTRRLLAGLFTHGGLPVAARERIEGRAGGNPFYVEEVIRSLLEQSAIEDGPGGLRATERIHRAAIPDTVQEVILSRVDRLDPERKQLLQLASVIGRSFLPEVLAEIAPGTSDLQGNLARLAEAQLLTEREEAGSLVFAFRHPMIQEITYDGILEGKRQELHRRVGEALEARLPEGTPGRHATLAYHFGKARDVARAEPHLFAAGDEAARSAASNEALHFFQEASRLYLELHPDGGDPAKQARLERSVGLAHFNRGQLVEASQHLNRALALMGERIPEGRTELWSRFAVAMLAVLPSLYLPLRRRRPAADEAQRERIRLMYSRAKAQVTGDPTRFVFDTMENLRHLARVDPATVEGSGGMYASVTGIFSWSGLSFDVSERFLRLAERIVDADDPRDRLQYEMMRFVHHFLAGNWSKEYEIDGALLDDCLRYGELWNVATHLGLEATLKLSQGRFGEARANIARVAGIEDAYAYDLASSNRHGCTAFLLLEQRETEAAREAADVYYTEHDEPMLNVLALGTRAKAEVLLGRLEEARDTLETADAIVAREGLMPAFQRGALERSRLLLELAEHEGALAAGDGRRARRALAAAARAGRRAAATSRKVAWHRSEVEGALGRLAWLRGRRRAAERWWLRGLATAARLGARPERARLALEIAGRIGPTSAARLGGRGGAQWLAEARAGFEALELHAEAAACAKLGSAGGAPSRPAAG